MFAEAFESPRGRVADQRPQRHCDLAVLNLSDAAALVATDELVSLVTHGYVDLNPSWARRLEQGTHHAGLADLHAVGRYRAPFTSQAAVTAVGASAVP